MPESHTHIINRVNFAVVKAMHLPQARYNIMIDTRDKLVRFYRYSPKRQHYLAGWIDDVIVDEAAMRMLKELCRIR